MMKMLSKPLVVFFTGANERAVISFCRSLRREEIPFCLVARNSQDPIYKTYYRRWVFIQRKVDQLNDDEFCKILLRIKSAFPGCRLVVAPSSESVNRLLLRIGSWLHRQKIEGIFISREKYLKFSEKERCLEMSRSFGLLAPQEYPSYKECYIPFVLKPRLEFSPDGERLCPILIRSLSDFNLYASSYRQELYFLQRYLHGQSFYYLYFRNACGTAALYQRNLLQQDAGKSILSAEVVGCPDQDTDRRLRRMLSHNDYRGFIMFEIMRHEGCHYLIESNPRLWGPMQLALQNGFNAGWLVLGDKNPPQLSEPEYFFGIWRKRYYSWLGGMVGQSYGRMRFFGSPVRVLSRLGVSFIYSDIWFSLDSMRLFIFEFKKNLKSD